MFSTNSGTTTHDDIREIARSERIRRPQVAKHRFSRLSAPAFDPALVSTTLNTVAARISGTDNA